MRQVHHQHSVAISVPRICRAVPHDDKHLTLVNQIEILLLGNMLGQFIIPTQPPITLSL